MKTIGDDAMFKENTPFRYDNVSSVSLQVI